MPFIQTLKHIGDIFGDQLARAVVGQDYKSKARFLARKQAMELAQGEEDLNYRRALAQSQRLGQVKSAIDFSTQSATVKPGRRVQVGGAGVTPEGEFGADTRPIYEDQPPSAEVADIPGGFGFDEETEGYIRTTAQQNALRVEAKRELEQAKAEAAMGSQQAQAELALARRLQISEGLDEDTALKRARITLMEAQAKRAGRAGAGGAGGPGGRPYPVRVTDPTTGRMVIQWHQPNGGILSQTDTGGIQYPLPSGEAVARASQSRALTMLDNVKQIFQADPTITGPVDKIANWFSRMSGDPNLNAVEASQALDMVENEIARAEIGSQRTAIEIAKLRGMLTGDFFSTDPEFELRLTRLSEAIAEGMAQRATVRGGNAGTGAPRIPRQPVAPMAPAQGQEEIWDFGPDGKTLVRVR